MRKLIILLIIANYFALFSQSSKLNDLQKKRELALREIENTTLLLNVTKKNTTNLLQRINLLSEQIRSRQQIISITNQQIVLIDKEQTQIINEIASLEINLKAELEAYSKALQGIIHKKQNKNKLLYVLSGKSLTESLRRMKYLKDYSDWRNKQALKIKQKQSILREKRILLDKSKKEKLALIDSRKNEETQLQQEEQVHQQEINDANEKQKELEALLITKQKQADNLNNQITKLIAEEVARQEREAKRIAQEQEKIKSVQELNDNTKTDNLVVKQTHNNKDIFVTKENYNLSSNFASNRGKLPMPVTGPSTIIGHFGLQQHNRWKVTTNNNGIDIQAQPGAQVRAVYSGEISRIVAFPGFNNCIIIRHGEYYTFYGNIQSVSVKQGQKIVAGQILGSVYTDTDSGNSQLHFQLWKGTTKLNPEQWLKK